MSIRPVDLQMAIPRSADVIKQSGLGMRPDINQEETAKAQQKKDEHAQQQVIKSEKATQSGVDKDGRNKEETPEQKRKRRMKELEQKANEPINEYGSKYYFRV